MLTRWKHNRTGFTLTLSDQVRKIQLLEDFDNRVIVDLTNLQATDSALDEAQETAEESIAALSSRIDTQYTAIRENATINITAALVLKNTPTQAAHMARYQLIYVQITDPNGGKRLCIFRYEQFAALSESATNTNARSSTNDVIT